MLAAAGRAGATVRRGTRVRAVNGGATPTADLERARRRDVRARLIVGADGRGSLARKWAGSRFARMRRAALRGVLLDRVSIKDDTGHVFFNPDAAGWR